mmetsp:Transcript_19224/g.27046  ORF Transcript_19224/g.27046 Transcript_19224/m.27046 type:complete len:178 (-) Transcript_19224:207-740(-)|eukprot:CAMPEP_0184858356 /NCGR_PEP_ID=MMETSP0580-20130426/3484_1 /TAXON_ID=1118495 /ORGANISM="Dactyliosolen fragilissimus" /LENGTH=177 /DNA_ID=CAMNT_0027354471 /DNA_START=74 /DNA_END=607 /DNA_ORIENTATION=-
MKEDNTQHQKDENKLHQQTDVENAYEIANIRPYEEFLYYLISKESRQRLEGKRKWQMHTLSPFEDCSLQDLHGFSNKFKKKRLDSCLDHVKDAKIYTRKDEKGSKVPTERFGEEESCTSMDKMKNNKLLTLLKKENEEIFTKQKLIFDRHSNLISSYERGLRQMSKLKDLSLLTKEV